jgi:hypothetical protein
MSPPFSCAVNPTVHFRLSGVSSLFEEDEQREVDAETGAHFTKCPFLVFTEGCRRCDGPEYLPRRCRDKSCTVHRRYPSEPRGIPWDEAWLPCPGRPSDPATDEEVFEGLAARSAFEGFDTGFRRAVSDYKSFDV